MMQDVFIRPGLLHHFAGKRDGAGRGQRDVSAPEAGAGGPGHVIELSRLAADVVGGVAGGNVHVARAAVKNRVSGDTGISRRAVVGDGIAVKDVVAEFDLDFAAKSVELARLLAFPGGDVNRLVWTDENLRLRAGLTTRLLAAFLARRLGLRCMHCRRCAKHSMTRSALLRDILHHSVLGKRLACHWGYAQKQVTNHARCDNKLKLGTHAVEDQPWQGTMASFPKAKPGCLLGLLPRFSGELTIRPMTCPVCGKPYPCAHSRRNTAALLDPEIPDDAGCVPVPPSQDLARGFLAALEARSQIGRAHV